MDTVKERMVLFISSDQASLFQVRVNEGKEEISEREKVSFGGCQT